MARPELQLRSPSLLRLQGRVPRLCWLSAGRTSKQERGEAVPCDMLGRRWNGAGLPLQGWLLGDPEQAGSSLGARGDVFSSLKFDFHDLFFAAGCHSQHWVRLCFPC